jgi:tellurite methyltransferase
MTHAGRNERERWNQRYADKGWSEDPSPWLATNGDLLPEPGRALDIAGGTGRNAIWLASRGWDVTIADVSDVALAFATERGRNLGAPVHTLHVDLSEDSIPAGPWDVLLLFHFLERALFPKLASALRPGGVLIGSLATETNLERNPRPPRPFILDDGELPGLISDFETVRYEECWADNHHDARFVARRPLDGHERTQ